MVTLFATGDGLNVEPFKIGQATSEVFKNTNRSLHSCRGRGNSYRFEFSEDDMNTRPTVKVGDDVYVQLYMDKFESTLSSIRAFNADTFVKQKPYEVVYRGQLIEPEAISGEKWKDIEASSQNKFLI